MNPLLLHNQAAWDKRAAEKGWYVDTARDEDFLNPLKIADPRGWLGNDVRGLQILCLAAGGGRHGPLFAAAGARVTVVDLSPAMLDLDRKQAAARGLNLVTVQTSMDDLGSLADQSFDVVFQPVSTCYVPDLRPVFAGVARVLKTNGLYLSQHKQPASLQSSGAWMDQAGGYVVERPQISGSPVPDMGGGFAHREAGTFEFLHRLQDILGGICAAGLFIEDVVEPKRGGLDAAPGTFEHRSAFLPPFLALKARRSSRPAAASSPPSGLWVPG